jgi:hypothetical protein
MSYEWSDRFNEFIADWMRQAKDLPCSKVTSVESNTYEQSGCPTCYSGFEYDVDISWVDQDGKSRHDTFSGRLEDIISYG